MAAVIKQQPDVIKESAEALAEQFGAGGDFLKLVISRAKEIIQKTFQYNFNKRFKESGIFGVVTDAVGSLFKKTKRPPMVDDTLKKVTETAPPRQPLVQGMLKGVMPPATQPNIASTQDENKIESNITPETNNPSEQLSLPGFERKEENPKEKKLIETEEKARIVLIGGITEEGVKNFKEKLPELFQEIFKKLPKQEQKESLQARFSERGLLGILPKGLLALGGGLALLLGGLAALVAGLQTDGPFKGLLKIFSKVGLQGGLKLLEKGAKTFLKNLTSVIKAPVGLLRTVTRTIGSIFGPGAYKKVLTGIKAAKGLFAKMLSGLVKLITPLLKRLPLIGTVISWGFAYSRFKSGDVVGGIIDVLSGIANLPFFGPIGWAIAAGLDVLNAFLDYKTGGATKETSQKKGNILMGWVKGVGEWFAKNAENFPLIGPLIKTGRLISEGKWAEALASVVEWIPGVSWILDWLGFTSEKRTQLAQEGINNVSNAISSFMTWINESVWGTITGFFTGIFDSVKSYWDNLSLDPRSWIGMAPEPPTPDKNQQSQDSKPKRKRRTALADGGVITEPTNALIGEAGPEAVVPLAKGGVVATQPTTTPIKNINESAVVPLEKYFNGKDFALSNNTLSQIAANTGSTGEGLTTLGKAIIMLAEALGKKDNNSSNNFIINGQQQTPSPPASQIVASNVDAIRLIRSQFAI